MELPANDPLNKITKSCVYRDEKSLEEYTGIIKRKYKLAGNPALGHYLGQYSFHVLTTTIGATRINITLVINRGDWENRADGRFLQEDVSYCDLRKHEFIRREILLKKIKDRENGFEYVAKLCALKCEELLLLNARMQEDRYVSQEIKEIVGITLSDDIPDEILLKLGLRYPPH